MTKDQSNKGKQEAGRSAGEEYCAYDSAGRSRSAHRQMGAFSCEAERGPPDPLPQECVSDDGVIG